MHLTTLYIAYDLTI